MYTKQQQLGKSKNTKVINRQKDAEWSLKIKELYGFKCEICGKGSNQIRLNTHHIFSRANRMLRWDIDNGCCLCSSHHTLGNFSAHKSPMLFIEFIREKRGEEWYQRLRDKARILRA